MKISSAFATIPLYAALVAAQTEPRCYDLMLDVPANATNFDAGVSVIDTDAKVAEWIIELDRWNAPEAADRVVKEVPITGTFSTYAQLCFPDRSKDKKVIQILSHGGGFDHRYWDVQIDRPQYSWVYAATNAGYTVLSYDRLGNGQSEKADAYTMIQAPLEVETLAVLTQNVRSGTLLDLVKDPASVKNNSATAGKYPTAGKLPSLPKFDKVVHVGHSLGSSTTANFLKKYGTLSSAAILTGFGIANHTITTAAPFAWRIAKALPQFADLPDGYLAIGIRNAFQWFFLHCQSASDPAGFTNEALKYGYDIAQPLTIGEQLGFFDLGVSPDFTGPLQVVIGEHDWPFCAADCNDNLFGVDFLKEMFWPNASSLEQYIQPGSGHGLTLHKNATAGYEVSFDFLAENGF